MKLADEPDLSDKMKQEGNENKKHGVESGGGKKRKLVVVYVRVCLGLGGNALEFLIASMDLLTTTPTLDPFLSLALTLHYLPH